MAARVQDFDDLETITEQLIADNKHLKSTLSDQETQVRWFCGTLALVLL